MNHLCEPCHATVSPRFTEKQGQYLAFIHAYTLVLGRPPAEADLQRYFRVTGPSVHSMIVTLERERLIQREPGRARTISVLVEPALSRIALSEGPAITEIDGLAASGSGGL